jgi:hypothetical protein
MVPALATILCLPPGFASLLLWAGWPRVQDDA